MLSPGDDASEWKLEGIMQSSIEVGNLSITGIVSVNSCEEGLFEELVHVGPPQLSSYTVPDLAALNTKSRKRPLSAEDHPSVE